VPLGQRYLKETLMKKGSFETSVLGMYRGGHMNEEVRVATLCVIDVISRDISCVIAGSNPRMSVKTMLRRHGKFVTNRERDREAALATEVRISSASLRG
jgi:hypothetical protein